MSLTNPEIKSTSSLKAKNIELFADFKDDEKNERIVATIHKGIKLREENFLNGSTEKDISFGLNNLCGHEFGKDQFDYYNFNVPDLSSMYGAIEVRKYSLETQRWVGHVSEITELTFSARLKDLSKGGTDEFVEFDINDIDLADRTLLKIGATFYWSISKTTSKDGQTKRESFIRFQRLRNWEVKEYDDIADSAANLYNNLVIE